ncbi:class I SAM-dependent methyltransferase [Streptomyces sioyaensis]|uniref:Class I SAM-dependent methyltransferase n=1 Tax=Streptomyces sioyaensis TaxID=67364 RepID=A0A4Q1QYQ7_9ACTN|nr:class I SAM-dependent methyltransferase [Streptomyces sioyaensis]MBM4792848.1 class I SAM-dependent methyltransferase [Streptomyces sioyaensis]RXS65134.1 class I SAM-dependent methyltransferase [Streptomyces sioyaensis]
MSTDSVSTTGVSRDSVRSGGLRPAAPAAGGQAALDPERLAYYRGYFTEFFQGDFVLGMGTEDILDTLAESGAGGDWLDLGSGPSTLFWSLALTGIRSVRSADAAPEAVAVLREFAESKDVPRSYEQVLDRYGRDPGHLEQMRGRIGGYHVFDAMSPWPAEFAGERFDLVTEFGLFGLAPTERGYRECFQHLREHVRPGGRVIGADWIRSARLITSEGHDNTYLTEELVATAVREAGLRLRASRLCPIKGDELYDALIVWSAEPVG